MAFMPPVSPADTVGDKPPRNDDGRGTPSLWRVPLTPTLSRGERRKWVALGAVLLGFALLAGLFSPSGPAIAQVAIPTAIERLDAASPQARAELYRQLHAQAEFLEKQSAVLKTVAKLVGPTVVHIEADVPKAALQYGHVRQVEEAGSGTIVQIENNDYVLTNRHVIHGAAVAAIRIRCA